MTVLDTNNNTIRATSDNTVSQAEKKFNWNKFITIFSIALLVATVATIALNSRGVIPDKFDIGPISSIPIADIACYTLLSEVIIASLVLLVEGAKKCCTKRRNEESEEQPQQPEPAKEEEEEASVASTAPVSQKTKKVLVIMHQGKEIVLLPKEIPAYEPETSPETYTAPPEEVPQGRRVIKASVFDERNIVTSHVYLIVREDAPQQDTTKNIGDSRYSFKL